MAYQHKGVPYMHDKKARKNRIMWEALFELERHLMNEGHPANQIAKTVRDDG